ncbi:exonuclease domain-containing protein [Weizmannia coagulans]|uniref:exonuclease domain-containing protein n=1 Tax=Heyndrickxia coagulans TaxID=1398 RepID=UPI0022443A9C|nr:exonuclease domain-containing protein [Heyndrickxia coagulans]MCW8783733.1 exonuclease domain-containing protein [Heyndrickxia coagulans]
MRVTELRELLEKYSKDDLSKMMIELYKAIPKKVRDEKEIDGMLQDFQQYKEAEKIKKEKEKHVDLNDLEREITQFIQNAYKQNYIAPNRYVSKKERPKWRFKVKSYIKQLHRYPLKETKGSVLQIYSMHCMKCYVMGVAITSLTQTIPLDLLVWSKWNYSIFS